MPRNRNINNSNDDKHNNLNSDVEEDYLDVDKQLPGQNYYCVSFVSPENFLYIIITSKHFIRKSII